MSTIQKIAERGNNVSPVSSFKHAELNGYGSFLERKAKLGEARGFRPTWMPDFLFDFQAKLTEWAILTGRSALLEDCGLGKSVQALVWAQNVMEHTNKPVLLLTPLAVGPQFVDEAAKFDIEAERSRDGNWSGDCVVVITNYQQLEKFDPSHFGGVVCDESSCIKHFKAATTATAAPNDYWELGTSSEALGYMGHRDMLTQFFAQETS